MATVAATLMRESVGERVAPSPAAILRALGRALRDETDPAQALRRASAVIIEQMGAARVVWAEPEAGGLTRCADTAAGAPDLWRDAAAFTALLAQGDAVVPADGIAAVPLLAHGKLVAAMLAQRADAWAPADLDQLTDIADRTWETVERCRCHARAAANDAVFAAFLHHAPFGIHLKDADGRYLHVNRELADAIGQPVAMIIGRDAGDLFDADTAERIAAMDARAAAGASVSEEFAIGARDRYASVQSISFPITGAQAAATGGFTIDLTQRKQAEAALERSREALYQSEKLTALGSLLAGVSHELNNPLSIVVAQAVMMERQAAGSDLAVRAVKIRAAADRCARIVQTFLAMARQKTPERVAVDLNAVANAALELAQYGLRSDGVGITRAFAPDLPRISADSDQLHQIVTNLIVNAQQAMAAERSLRWLEVRTGVGPEPGTVHLEVSDSGPGIAPDLRRRVFEPFFTTKPQGEGTGVGLSFCQGLAEAHGGRLTLVPSERGATFRLTLPIDEGKLLPRVEPVTAGHAPAVGRRALIVDDEEEIALSLADILSLEGFACDIVVGGAAAQARLGQGEAYDLVVSDLRMPDVDGPALYAWIVAHRPDLAARTAFTTGDTLGATVARFIADAGRPVLEKPFMPDSVRRFLGQLS